MWIIGVKMASIGLYNSIFIHVKSNKTTLLNSFVVWLLLRWNNRFLCISQSSAASITKDTKKCNFQHNKPSIWSINFSFQDYRRHWFILHQFLFHCVWNVHSTEMKMLHLWNWRRRSCRSNMIKMMWFRGQTTTTPKRTLFWMMEMNCQHLLL